MKIQIVDNPNKAKGHIDEYNGESLELKIGDVIKYTDTSLMFEGNRKPVPVLCKIAWFIPMNVNGTCIYYYFLEALKKDMNKISDPSVLNRPFYNMVASTERSKFEVYKPSKYDDEDTLIGYSELCEILNLRKPNQAE